MRFLKICDIIKVAEIADKDKSDYEKGFKSLTDCEFENYEKKIYKLIDIDFIKYIEYDEEEYEPCFTIHFKDKTEMELSKIHLYKVVTSLGKVFE